MFLDTESTVVTIERQGSQLKITCVNADAGNESNDLEELHWYKDEIEIPIVVWKRSTNTATMGKEVRINNALTQTYLAYMIRRGGGGGGDCNDEIFGF